MENKGSKKAWIVAINMGYGHQRTAYPLRDLAPNGIVINANDYEGIPERDREIWRTARKFYEFISRFKRAPIVGSVVFSLFDRFQRILSYYPKRDLSKPNLQLRQILSLVKRGWGKDLIQRLKRKPLPLISTFFTPAFMAEFFGYPGDIYCVICDADVSRTWAPINPKTSKIHYFAPNVWVVNRLKLYGVKKENIFLTGYPLPSENIGTEKLEILKDDIKNRLLNLDPNRIYFRRYKAIVDEYLGALPEKSNHPLTLMFAVGGAGAQKEIGRKIIRSLSGKIKRGEIKVVLVAGIRRKVRDYFQDNIKKLGIENVEILYQEKIEDYFSEFNQRLRTTDILWTKPSELSFYSALGLPIIIAPPIGSQEDFNRKWLLDVGAGMVQRNPDYSNQWIFDSLSSGRFAELALQGFIEEEKLGVFNIAKIISGS